MTVAAYVRVSSASQDAKMQRHAIATAAAARGLAVRTWYEDTKSGGTLARPELVRLREDVRAGRVRTLLVFRLDRLTRSGIRDTLSLLEEFRAHGCELVSVSDGFDLAGPAAEVVLAVLAWAAKVERVAIGERISAARARVEEKGGAWGRPKRMSPDQVKRAVAMRDGGETIRGIASRLRVPRATVARALASQKPAKKSFRPGPLKSRSGK